MPKCQDITPKRKKICIGALRITIDIKDRDLEGPVNFGDEAHAETFKIFKTVKAGIETKAGNVFQTLDGVAQDPRTVVTHVFLIRFTGGVSTEQFVEHDGINYKILRVINIDLRNRWLKLNCNERGIATKAGAQ